MTLRAMICNWQHERCPATASERIDSIYQSEVSLISGGWDERLQLAAASYVNYSIYLSEVSEIVCLWAGVRRFRS